MKLWRERFKHNGLFVKMFIITVVSMIAVSVIITWTTIRMSEKLFAETFSITNAKVMNQIRESFESFHYSVVIASNNVLQSGAIKRFLTEDYKDPELMRAYYNINQQMKRVKSNLDVYEMGITITGANGVSFSTDRSYWPVSDDELRRHTITKKTLEDPRRLLYQYDIPPFGGGGEPTIIISKAFMERSAGTIYGAMYFAIKENQFKRFYSSYTSTGNDVVIMNKSGRVVSSNRSEMIGNPAMGLLEHARNIEKEGLSYVNSTENGKHYIVLAEYLPSLDMYLVNRIDKETAIGRYIDKQAIVMIIIAVVSVALIIVFLVSRRLTKSLSRLVKQIGNVSKYDFDHYVAVSGTYETRQIGIAFNSMLDELHEYVENLVQSEKKVRNAELAALQQQINPHFLYNTLASIKFMVQQGGKEEAVATIHALISLLQNAIGNVSETITIEQELENLKNYVFINHKRYGDRIKVNYFISPDSMEVVIPKLIIQPFMENAFFHGFNRKAEGSINVLVWHEGDALICEVVDNGDGMRISADDQLPEFKSKRKLFEGIGVRNVHERILLMYGDTYGVTITSKLNEGTKVRIRLPYILKS
ncbi:membrane protein [Paenibacillus swuensis]|uniref:Membrane protein n=1 Tax=Paenibacillus swuensis TaxID=1178515 RepID=A0A172TGV6_9BACL|nr:sensor histidine kinase [Paenibacillus swuensis]ANE46279.1 membrane protein [Paenibacillus swuensis]